MAAEKEKLGVSGRETHTTPADRERPQHQREKNNKRRDHRKRGFPEVPGPLKRVNDSGL